jgi:small-conductance mechanosensitive channel
MTIRPITLPPKNTMFSSTLRDGPEFQVLGESATAGDAIPTTTDASTTEAAARRAVMADMLSAPSDRARRLVAMASPSALRWIETPPWEWSVSRETAYDWFVARPISILLILLIAFVVRWLVRRAIDRIVRRASEGSVPSVLARTKAGEMLSDLRPGAADRRRERALTMGSVLKSIAGAVIMGIAAITILAELGVNIAPILTGAGIVGVALGFGAQNFVKDFLAGIFMILEDQLGVGDLVDTGHAIGTVEAVGLRVTRLRDDQGTIWYVRNGEILRIGNVSQGRAAGARNDVADENDA